MKFKAYWPIIWFSFILIFTFFPLMVSRVGKILKRTSGCVYRESNANYFPSTESDCQGDILQEDFLETLIDGEMWLLLTVPIGILATILLVLILGIDFIIKKFRKTR